MKDLNKLRLLAGIPIDASIEKTIKEARDVPKRRHELTPKDVKSLDAQVRGLTSAINHISNAIKALDKIPAIDFAGDVPHVIHELELILSGDGSSAGGIKHLLTMAEKEHRSHVRAEAATRKEAEQQKPEETEPTSSTPVTESEDLDESEKTDDSAESDESEKKSEEKEEDSTDEKDEEEKEEVKEAEANYYYDTEDGKGDETKDLDLRDETSPLDDLGAVSGTETEQKVKVPPAVKQAIKAEIENAKKEAGKQNVTNRDAVVFYNELARALQDLQNYLDAGTVTDIKKAQVYWSSLMSPITHAIPKVVNDFIVNGGQRRPLKSYIVKDKQ